MASVARDNEPTFVADEEGLEGQQASTTTNPSLLASKRVVYVGGLADKTTVPLLRAAFVPFGTIASVDMVRTRRIGRERDCGWGATRTCARGGPSGDVNRWDGID